MTLFIRIELVDPGFDWQQEDPKRAALIQEKAEAVALDAAVEATGWDGCVSSYYPNPWFDGLAGTRPFRPRGSQ